MTQDKLVILPWRSEYGTMLMHHVRWVHSLQAQEKVVFCRKGNEVLFPSATSFRYDWQEALDVDKRSKLFRDPQHLKYMAELEVRCRLEYPEHRILNPPRKHPNRPEVQVPLESGRLGRKVDVVLAPRYRQHAQNRNFQHWGALADGLQERGFVVGLVGAKATSQDLGCVPEDLKGWNLGGDREQLQLMNTARLTVCTDSGIAHLAVLNGNPLMVIYDREGFDGPNTKNAWTIPHMRAHSRALCEPLVCCWHDPVRALNSISNFLLTG